MKTSSLFSHVLEEHPASWLLASIFGEVEEALAFVPAYVLTQFVPACAGAKTYDEVVARASEFPNLEADCFAAIDRCMQLGSGDKQVC